jgi:RNA-directed DNA polymerase
MAHGSTANAEGTLERTSFGFLGYTFRGHLARDRRRFFVNISPAMSAKAMKAISKWIRDWHLNRRSGTDPSDIAQGIDSQVRGWINNCELSYRSELYSGDFDRDLVRWAIRKFRRSPRKPQIAWACVNAARLQNPRILVHLHLHPLAPT